MQPTQVIDSTLNRSTVVVVLAFFGPPCDNAGECGFAQGDIACLFGGLLLYLPPATPP